MKKEKNERKKKVIVIAVLAVCFVVAGIIAGVSLTKDTVAKDAPDLKANEVEIVNEDGEVEVVEKDSKEAAEYKDAVKTGERDTVKETKKSEKNNSSSNKNSTSSSNKTSSTNKNNSSSSTNKNNTSSSDKNTNSSNKNNSSSSSSSSSSDKKNDSSSSSTKPTTHTHSWTAVYATKQVQVGTERQCVGSIRCCVCGARDVGYAHTEAHMEAGEPNNTWREYIYDDVPIYETKEYVDYYKCSCGATK